MDITKEPRVRARSGGPQVVAARLSRLSLQAPISALLVAILICGNLRLGPRPALAMEDGSRSGADDIPESQRLYDEALALRESGGASLTKLRDMLVEASGAQFDERGQDIAFPKEEGHPGALFELYRIYQDGQGGMRNRQLAASFLSAASQAGWPDAQAEMGFRQLVGLWNASTLSDWDVSELSKADVPRAMLNLYFSAQQNSSFANLILGYRHSVGLGVPKSCASAVLYYNRAAEEVIANAREFQGFPQLEKLRLSYKTISGMHRSREAEVLEYYQYTADLGNVEAQTAVGHFLNHGAQGLERDHERALKYFLRAAEHDDPKAMSHLGHMYANGQGVEPNNETALEWFNKGAARNSPSSMYGLGYLYLSGYGVKKDAAKAFNYFTLAAEQTHPEAQFHLGIMHLKGWGTKQDRQRAFYYFNLASHAGHPLAQYNAAMLQLSSDPTVSGCEKALGLLKQVAERGLVAEVLQEARVAFLNGQPGDALWSYLRAAEMGSELGLANAAFMLRQGLGTSTEQADVLSVSLYSRAADQMNVQALLYVADAHYFGRGVGLEWSVAGKLYEKATERSAQALFNLGYMHQFGAGLKQDLHLAKRYYDLAQHQDPEAAIPVQIALLGLKVHSWMSESILPLLPVKMGSSIRSMFLAVKQPETPMPRHVFPSLGWLDGAMDFLDWEPAQENSYDTALLLFLFLALGVVIRRRRVLRQQMAVVERDPVDDIDPLGGLVGDPNLRGEWGDAVRPQQ